MERGIIGTCILLVSVALLLLALGWFIYYNIIRRILEWEVRKTVCEKLGNKKLLYRRGYKPYLLYYDAMLSVGTAETCRCYDLVKFYHEHKGEFDNVRSYLDQKCAYADSLMTILNDEEVKAMAGYKTFLSINKPYLSGIYTYNVLVEYIGANQRWTHTFAITRDDFEHPERYMTDSEYTRYLKGQEKDALKRKQDDHFAWITEMIEEINFVEDALVIARDMGVLEECTDTLLGQPDKIRRIKESDSVEWDMLDTLLSKVSDRIEAVVERNKEVTDYYNSEDFQRIKDTCNSLMESQREFNEYIKEKAEAISSLFGTRVVRDETEMNDEYDYTRPYKKNLTPFTAEVSSTVFASAENNPLDYVVKCFYTDKSLYPEQIQKLQLLVEELETLSEARDIIENYKKDYQQYIEDVPKFIMQEDEDGFYARLGFANISEDVLTVEYRFSYTSEGGLAQRSFTVPMTEENIVALIEKLQDKLSMSTFAKEQRSLMTSKLRQRIKERDNYTCRYCGNSTHKEPNLLLEIDHILPVAKGGCTVEDNLQTLCWKCNRQKSDRIVEA